jgi:inorganic pyrophosphatase
MASVHPHWSRAVPSGDHLGVTQPTNRTDPVRFWALLDELVATSEIAIDRPGGSAHPRVPEIIYPFDYGYLTNTVGGDGDGIDAWRGSLPDAQITGVIATVSVPQRDAELKLLIGCTPEEMQQALTTHCQTRQAGILIPRPAR